LILFNFHIFKRQKENYNAPVLNVSELAEEVRQQRQLLGITQMELAEVAAVSLRSVKLLEAGQANPTFKQLNQLLDALGLQLIIRRKQ
jgi:predicted transcriptional regulator